MKLNATLAGIFIIIAGGILSPLMGESKNSSNDNGDFRVDEHDAEYAEKMKSLQTKHRPNMPQLFFCGDSISVGYGPAFKLALIDKVNAIHRKDLKIIFTDFPKFGYAGPIGSLGTVVKHALDYEKYSPKFLMINAGLHDIHRGRNNIDKTLSNYLATIKRMQAKAEENEVKIIWVTTTPLGSSKSSINTGNQKNKNIERFNQEAVKLMENHYTIDLGGYTSNLIKKYSEEKIMTKDHVHFTEFAQIEQGKFLATQVLKIMQIE